MFQTEFNNADKKSGYHKEICFANSDSKSLDNFIGILLKKSSLSIKFENNSDNISIKLSSIKRIFSNGYFGINKYINYYFNKKLLSQLEIKNLIKEKEINDETTEEDEEETTTVIVKKNEPSKSQKNLDKDKQAIQIDVKNKNENIFNPELPLLNQKITNTFSNIENMPNKYINLIILCNKITISIDFLKYLYLTLFFCGLLNLKWFFIFLFGKIKIYDLLYHFFLLPMALLLMITGLYGYKKVNKNIYDDKYCLIFTYLCFFAPIFGFSLSKLSSEDFIRKKLMVNNIINFISSLFSFICITIIKEIKRVNICEKDNLNA